jgi:hypothetical protein
VRAAWIEAPKHTQHRFGGTIHVNAIEFIDKATEDEILEVLATKVMGWTKASCGHDPERYGAEMFAWVRGTCPVGYCQDFQFAKQWNPLRNLADASQLQIAVSQDRALFRLFILRLDSECCREWPMLQGLHGCNWSLADGLFATAEHRARAAFAAVQIQQAEQDRKSKPC